MSTNPLRPWSDHERYQIDSEVEANKTLSTRLLRGRPAIRGRTGPRAAAESRRCSELSAGSIRKGSNLLLGADCRRLEGATCGRFAGRVDTSRNLLDQYARKVADLATYEGRRSVDLSGLDVGGGEHTARRLANPTGVRGSGPSRENRPLDGVNVRGRSAELRYKVAEFYAHHLSEYGLPPFWLYRDPADPDALWLYFHQRELKHSCLYFRVEISVLSSSPLLRFRGVRPVR